MYKSGLVFCFPPESRWLNIHQYPCAERGELTEQGHKAGGGAGRAAGLWRACHYAGLPLKNNTGSSTGQLQGNKGIEGGLKIKRDLKTYYVITVRTLYLDSD